MKWIVTGGCGFLGSNIADEALGRGDDVVILDNLSRTGARDNLAWLRQRHGEAWRFVEMDVRDADCVKALVADARPDAIAHLAGQVAMTTSLENPRADFETNALGSLNVLEAVRLAHPEAVLLYSSTNKVYGDLDHIRYEERETRYATPDHPAGFDETTPLDFASPYGCSKGAADQYTRDYARCYGLRTIVFRHSSMYGGRQFATVDQGWIGWFCKMAVETRLGRRRTPFSISGSGKQVRDVLHADDMRRLYLAAYDAADAAAGQIFNIGGGMENSLSLLELFAILEGEIGHPLEFTRGPERQSDQKVFVANIAKAGDLIGWAPQVTAADGLCRMLTWTEDVAGQPVST